MSGLIYFSKAGDSKKAYQLIQSRRGEPWQIVDGDELIGEMQKMQGLWKLHSPADIPEELCEGLAMLIESQHFNKLPEEIKTHWPGMVLDVVVKDDAEYLIICQPNIDLERFVKVFAAYVPHLLKDEWPILFKIYDAEMREDFEVTVQRGGGLMEQLSMFREAGQSPGLPEELLEYHPALFTENESSILLNHFIASSPWKQKIVRMYDKEVVTPRLTAWYADEETYDYTSLRRSVPNIWTPELLMIRKKVEDIAGIRFNSVLLNYYRDGNDSVAWHSDNEKALGTHPVIASVSFGQVRCFDIRNKLDHGEKYSIRLESGALMIMKGDLQQNWEHRIAKSIRPMKARVNLTFRNVI